MVDDCRVQVRDHEIKTTTFKVLLFPVNGDQPHLVDMVFSEAGAKSHPRGFYSTAVDLRGLYGKYTAGYTRLLRFDIQDHEEPLDGRYHLYYNISPRLPVNHAMARIVGVDPKRPSSRPMWKGDVVIIKKQPEMESEEPKSGIAEKTIRGWYNSDMWAPNARIQHESLDFHLANEEPTDPRLKLLKDLGTYELVTDEKKRRKQEKIYERVVADGAPKMSFLANSGLIYFVRRKEAPRPV
ncbi:uncharacterized protein BT62DRAFT_921348 [Guyanagaster necrorhizus]|uniref:Uncharacterized protein n=1 Tax=Guyanagaster necrorhizus TaxID=856835 RepID=A0A9P7VQ96_9AGAR|nr:uncharacterized protein BT62DRAFT_921348 [Guyanagaster necrorhizus MCA 3950]KAG7444056.1 hypothetical protein BT62DRAFT_921348 [Guyanagaster necrorhizus MCA 3950]